MKYWLFLLIFTSFDSNAQTLLRGLVTDQQGEALPGANVFLPGTYDGATTDSTGRFTFSTTATGERTLLVLFLGCDTFRQTLNLDGKIIPDLNIKLAESRGQLREVVVTAGNFEAGSDRKRATVLSSLDIALAASASADIAGAIAMLPGVTRNGESGQILVRGGAAYETRTFMDGLLVQNPNSNTVNNLPARNRFSPFLFKGTVFSTGGYSAEYGQAMSSALILNTEDLAPKTATGITLLSVGGGLAHTHRWERSSLSVSGAYNNLSPYFAIVPQKVDWLKAPASGMGEFTYRQQTSENGGMLKFYGNVNRSDMQMMYPDDEQSSTFHPLRLTADNVYGNVSYRDMVDKNWFLFAGAAYSYNNALTDADFENEVGQQSLQARFTLARPLGESWRLKWGGEFLKGRHHNRYADSIFSVNGILNETYGSLFAETDVFLTRKLVGRFGVRGERSGMLDKANVAPRVSMAYVLGKNEQFSMAFGKFYQTPEYEQLLPSTDVGFENATHLMVNYQRMKDGYVFRVEAYRKWYDNLLKNGAGNSGSGYAQGVDVFWRDNKTIRRGDYWVSYSLLDTRRDWRDFPQSAVPDFAMKHSFSVAYKQFFPKANLAFSASYAFNSGRPYYDPNLPSEQFNSSRTPAYHDVSATLTYLTNLWGHFTVVYLSVTNLPGFSQVFSYEYASQPGPDGFYQSAPVTPPAKRFGVLAVIVSIGEKYDKDEVTGDDY